MLRRMLFMLGAVVVVVAILAAFKFNSIYQQIQQFQAPKPAINVEAEVARRMDWQSRLPAIGTLKASQGIDLSVEIAGTISDVQFQSGEKVSKGQAIVLLDSEVEQASLASAEADLNLSRLEFQRARSLLDRQAISRSEYDRLNAQSQKAEASVAQLRASLAKKRVLAPFSGTIGIRQVDVGDYLSSGTTIATLQDLSKLYVDFFLPEQAVPKLAVGVRVRFSVAAYPDEVFEGEIAAINPKVEDATRNVQVRAMLVNPESKLLPGMFANLEVLLPGEQKLIVVPETAITYTLYGNSVYVIDEKKGEDGQVVKDAKGQAELVVERRFVDSGERRDGQVVISKGLQAGEQVVSAGQLKLDNGAHVSIANAQAKPSVE